MNKDITTGIRDAADYSLDCEMNWLKKTKGKYITKKGLKTLKEYKNIKYHSGEDKHNDQ